MSSLDDGGNSFRQATRLGTVRFGAFSSGATAAGFMEAGETVDWYQVKAKGRASSSVIFKLSASPSINQTLDVYFRPASKTQGRGKRVASFSGGTSEIRDLKPLAGTYFLKISQAAGTVAANDVYQVSLVTGNPAASFKSASKNSGTARSQQGKDLFF
jgi:hypothetical protein